jgi:hypothetical protein
VKIQSKSVLGVANSLIEFLHQIKAINLGTLVEIFKLASIYPNSSLSMKMTFQLEVNVVHRDDFGYMDSRYALGRRERNQILGTFP